MPDPTHDVIDDEEHADPDQPDIGKLDLDGDGIPDDLDVGDLDELVAHTPDDNERR
jgi:hypothetical protein